MNKIQILKSFKYELNSNMKTIRNINKFWIQTYFEFEIFSNMTTIQILKKIF
jgi:hypothetical protein